MVLVRGADERELPAAELSRLVPDDHGGPLRRERRVEEAHAARARSSSAFTTCFIPSAPANSGCSRSFACPSMTTSAPLLLERLADGRSAELERAPSQIVVLHLLGREAAREQIAQVAEGSPLDHVVEQVVHAEQVGLADLAADEAVLHRAVAEDEHGEQLARLDADEAEVLQRQRLRPRRDHDGGRPRELREELAALAHQVRPGAQRLEPLADLAQVLGRQVARAHEGVDEEAEGAVGRDAPGARCAAGCR